MGKCMHKRGNQVTSHLLCRNPATEVKFSISPPRSTLQLIPPCPPSEGNAKYPGLQKNT